jgi:hypothetical protein
VNVFGPLLTPDQGQRGTPWSVEPEPSAAKTRRRSPVAAVKGSDVFGPFPRSHPREGLTSKSVETVGLSGPTSRGG